MTHHDKIRQYLLENPQSLIGKIHYNNQDIWIKRRPHSKATIWHTLLHYLSYLLPLPIIYPTVVSEVQNSLVEEAERFALFAQNNIPVPQVLMVDETLLATSDVGKTMQEVLETAADGAERSILLKKAVTALGRLHQRNLCHGRPSLRDMTYQNGQVYFIDLEEDPLQVMNLAEAQARDLWLLFFSMAKQSKDNLKAMDLFTAYLPAKPKTMRSLKQMVFFLKPFLIFVEYGLFALKSRDLKAAVLANKLLEPALKKYPRLEMESV